jgi:hypothetical protein
MAKKDSGRKGAAIVAIIAAMAFFGGAQSAAADVQASPSAPAIEIGFLAPELASWAEEASWAES